MSLDWSTKKCLTPAPHGQHEAEERDRIIFATAAVGLSTVSRDNLHEWLVRLTVFEEIGRGLLLGPGALGQLERWIGLETNVTDETREEWTGHLLAAAFDRAECKADGVFDVPCGLRPMPC